MEIIPISGIIGSYEFENELNVTPVTLRKSLTKANGQDVLITINSEGGSAFHGLEMFSLIKNYSGKTETRIISLAASMGSILALAGQKKSIENTALYYIHNPWSLAIGDYRDFEKEAKFLKDLAGLLAELYAENTTLSKSKAQKLMDDESSFYGEELAALGFETVETGQTGNPASARVLAKPRLQNWKNKMSPEDYMEDLKKVAASISSKKYFSLGINLNPQVTVNSYHSNAKLVDETWSKSESESRWRDHANVESRDDLPNRTYTKRFVWYDSDDNENFGAYKFPIFDYKQSQGGEFVNVSAVRNGLARVGNSNIPSADKDKVRGVLEKYLNRWNEENDLIPASAGKNNKTEVIMNLEEFKKENPDLYAQVVQIGKDQERDRVKAHLTLAKQANCLDIAVKHIEDGTEFTNSVTAEYMAAGMKNQSIQNRKNDDVDTGGGQAGDDDKVDTEAYKNELLKARGVK